MYGTMATAMRKTTVYLPTPLKEALAREAARRGTSEAELIRAALIAVVARPRPAPGWLDGEPIADSVDELLLGFGEP